MRSQWWVLWDAGVAVLLVYLGVHWWGPPWGRARVIGAVVCFLAVLAHVYSASRYWRRWRGVTDENAKRDAQVMYTDDAGNPEAPCGLHQFDEHHSRYCHLKKGSAAHIAITPAVVRHMTFVRPAPTAEVIQREWISKGATGPHPSPRGMAGDGEVAFEWREWTEDGRGGG